MSLPLESSPSRQLKTRSAEIIMCNVRLRSRSQQLKYRVRAFGESLISRLKGWNLIGASFVLALGAWSVSGMSWVYYLLTALVAVGIMAWGVFTLPAVVYVITIEVKKKPR